MLDAAIYDRLIGTAATISEPLRAAIAAVGLIEIAPPSHASLAERLFVEVVNQQLSTKAALSIWTRVEAAAAAQAVAPRDLFVTGYEDLLRGCGVSANKVRALQAIR